MTTEMLEEPTDTDVQALEAQILLVFPTMGYYRGRYQLKTAKVALGGRDIDDDSVTAPSIKLLECCDYMQAWGKKFAALNTARHKLLDALTVCSDMDGVRIVPSAALGDLFRGLVEEAKESTDASRPLSIRAQLFALRDDFVSNWPVAMEHIQESLPSTVWNAIWKRLPNQGQLRRSFYLNCPAVSLANPNDTKLMLSKTDLAQFGDFIAETTGNQIDAAAEAVVTEPRQELIVKVTALRTLIEADGNVTVKSFRPVNAAIHKLRLFGFAALEPELSALVQQLSIKLRDLTPVEQNAYASQQNGLLPLLAAVVNQANDADSRQELIQNFGGRCRRLFVS